MNQVVKSMFSFFERKNKFPSFFINYIYLKTTYFCVTINFYIFIYYSSFLIHLLNVFELILTFLNIHFVFKIFIN